MKTTTPPPNTPIIPMHEIYFSLLLPNIVITLSLFLLGSIIMALNSLLFRYYYTKHGVLVYDKLFLLLSGMDAATGLAAVLQSFIFTAILTNNRQTANVILTVTSLLTAITFHTSAFYNVLLAVCRTVTLHSPFFQLNGSLMYGIAVTYPFIWALLSVYELHSVYTNFPSLVDRINLLLISPLCGSELIYNTSPHFTSWGYYVILLGVPYVIPALVCLVCCCITFASLRPSLRGRSGTAGFVITKSGHSTLVSARQHRNFRATVTIFQLSAAFFVCSSLFFTTEFTLQILNPEGTEEFESYIVYLAANVLPVLNSLINPAILINRGTKLQTFINRLVGEGGK